MAASSVCFSPVDSTSSSLLQTTSERVKLLARALSDPHVSVVWNAARDLARLQTEAKAALPALAAVLQHTDATSRLWARYAIVKITGALEPHLPQFISALEDRTGIFPGMASSAIAGLGPDAAEAIPALIRELEQPNSEYRWSAAGALARMGPLALAAAPGLITALQDPDEKVRWYSAWALGEIGSKDAISGLCLALEDVDDDVRGHSALAIGKIGGREAVDALPRILGLCSDDNPSVAEAANNAIAMISEH